VPSKGAGTPPTHLPDSSVARLFPACRCVPGLRKVTAITRPAIVCAASVSPIVKVPSSFGRAHR